MMLPPTSMSILEYLYHRPFVKNGYSAPYENTTGGISDATGILRTVVCQRIAILEDAGYVECEKFHVGNVRNKVRCFWITDEGRRSYEAARAREMRLERGYVD